VVVKTTAIRLDDQLHARLVILAQLDGVPMAEILHRAITGYVDGRRSEPGFAEKAKAVLSEIDEEARARREAIEGLFADDGPDQAETPSAQEPEDERRPNGRGRRGQR
jgi:predicted DNA-binding protein